MLTIALPSEIERRLRAQANERGLDISEYASRLIVDHLPAEPNGNGHDVPQIRGTSPASSERAPLFTELTNTRPQDLPKWKPQVTLTRRDLAESDDE